MAGIQPAVGAAVAGQVVAPPWAPDLVSASWHERSIGSIHMHFVQLSAWLQIYVLMYFSVCLEGFFVVHLLARLQTSDAADPPKSSLYPCLGDLMWVLRRAGAPGA